MLAYAKTLWTRFFPAYVEPEKTAVEKTLEIRFDQVAAFHAGVSPEECKACGLTNGMTPFEVVFRVLQHRAGEPVTGNYAAALAAHLHRENR
jgi:hypothetical protein